MVSLHMTPFDPASGESVSMCVERSCLFVAVVPLMTCQLPTRGAKGDASSPDSTPTSNRSTEAPGIYSDTSASPMQVAKNTKQQNSRNFWGKHLQLSPWNSWSSSENQTSQLPTLEKIPPTETRDHTDTNSIQQTCLKSH